MSSARSRVHPAQPSKETAAPAHPLILKYTEALQRARERGSRPDEAGALFMLGKVHLQLGTPALAVRLALEALAIDRHIGDAEHQGLAIELAAAACRKLRRFSEARRWIRLGLDLARQADRQDLVASHLAMVGETYYEEQKPKRAIPYLEQAAQLAQGLGLAKVHGGTLLLLSQTYSQADRPDDALVCMEQARDQLHRAGHRGGECSALVGLAIMRNGRGQLGEAIDLLEAAAPTLRQLADFTNLAVAMRELGSIYEHQQRYDRAIACYEQQLEALHHTGDKQAQCVLLQKLGEVCWFAKQLAQANEFFAQRVGLARELGDGASEGQALYWLACTFKDPDLSTVAYWRALPLLEKAGHRALLASALTNLGRLLTEQDRPQEALPILLRAVAFSQQIGYVVELGRAQLDLGLAYRMLGEPRQAIDPFTQATELARKQGDEQLLALASHQLSEARAAAAAEAAPRVWN